MVEGFKELLVALQAAGVVHDHGLPHGEREKQHGHNGGDDAGPAQTHIVGVGLIAGGEAAACVSGEQDCAHRKGGKEGGLGNFCVGFHDFYLLQMLSDGWQEKQKTFRRSCRLAEETKGRKPSAVPLFFVPCIGNTLNGIPSYPCCCNGSSRLHLLPIRRSRYTASSAA